VRPRPQERREADREREQRELARDVGVCPFDGLCEWCAAEMLREHSSELSSELVT
jgi:hypothetical protein